MFNSVKEFINKNIDVINKSDWSQLQYWLDSINFTAAEIYEFWSYIQDAGIEVDYKKVALNYSTYISFIDERLDSDEIDEIRKYCPSIHISEIKDQKQLFELFLKNFHLQLDIIRLQKYIDKINSGTYENRKLETCKVAVTPNPYSKRNLDISICYKFTDSTYGHTAIIMNCDSEMFLAIPGLCIAMNEKLINDKIKQVKELLLK